MTKNEVLKTGFKHLLIDFAVVIGNIFLSHGLFYVLMWLCDLCRGLGDIFMNYQQFLLIAICAVQIAINIVLYKILLKRYFKPAEHKITAFYFLLPVIGCALWIGSIWLCFFMELCISLESYWETLISFLPIILLTLIPLAVVYRLFFRKYIGEAYCVYLLSFLGVAIMPVTFTYLIIGSG